MTNYWQKIQLSTALGMALISSMIYPPSLQANPVKAVVTPTKFTPPPPPRDRGAPGSRSSAASRGCGDNNQTLIALVPAYQQTVSQANQAAVTMTTVWGLTDMERPSLLFFVPYDASLIANMEFVLQKQINNIDKTIYRASQTPPKSSGIISVSLPETITPLESEIMYHWFLKVKVKCNPQQPSQLYYVDGWIQRSNKNPTLTALIQQAKPQQKVAIYAEKGIWYDAIATLAQLRLANPKDTTLLANWTSLLNSVGLESLANQPFTDCCK